MSLQSLFTPSESLGLAARQAITIRLAESISYVLEQCEGHLTFNKQATDDLINRLTSDTPKAPFIFGLFYELVTAIKSNDLGVAQKHLDTLLSLPLVLPVPTSATAYNTQDYSDEELSLITNRFRNKSGEPIIAPSQKGSQATDQVKRALDMLRKGAPQTAGEMDAVVTTFLLATGKTNQRTGSVFEGVSNLEMWGMSAINETPEKSDLDMAETLAHETAHCTLFGLSPVNFFVTNPDSERYGSPLRVDARPLDGIYHATFVCARMQFAVAELIASGTLNSEEMSNAEQMLKNSVIGFKDGHETLMKHADFTERGREIMDAAANYMSERPAA